MARFDHPLGTGAPQDVRYVSASIALSGAYHGGEYLLSDDRRVELLHVREAYVASSTVRVPELLTEVAQ